MRARTHSNPLNFYQRLPKMDLPALFPNYSGSVDVEVGPGMGQFIRKYAAAFPERCIVGVEVRKKVADIVSERLENDELRNALMVYGSAERLIEDSIPVAVMERVFVFHPDPWFKKRHHNRRVIRPEFLTLLQSKMKVGGRLYISTDVTPLWEAMTDTLRGHGWVEVDDTDFWQTQYHTNWKQFTESVNRAQHFATFVVPGMSQAAAAPPTE